jgi:hypothetical protein
MDQASRVGMKDQGPKQVGLLQADVDRHDDVQLGRRYMIIAWKRNAWVLKRKIQHARPPADLSQAHDQEASRARIS